MKFKYKMMLSIILLLLTFSIYICFNYNSVMNAIKSIVSNDALVFSMDDISVNYLTGDQLNYKKGGYVKEFSVTNVSDNEIYYNLDLINVINVTNGKNITLRVESTNSGGVLESSSFPIADMELINKIKIESGVTQRYKLYIDGEELVEGEMLEARIYVSVDENKKNNNEFVNVILRDNEIKNATTIPGSAIATTDEGLIKDVDDYGDTYYFRGAVENNYVEFANYKWRIVRITGDNKVKLVLDEDLNAVYQEYNTNAIDEEGDIVDLVQLGTASAQITLNNWYDKVLINYDRKIEEVKYGVSTDFSSNNGNIHNFKTYDRLFVELKPTFNVTGKVMKSKIGLLSADEVVFAGGSTKDDNKSYYLYNEKIVNDTFTYSPYTYNETNGNLSMVSISSETGKISYTSIKTKASLRPVIVLNENVKVNGSGTIDNPYVIS